MTPVEQAQSALVVRRVLDAPPAVVFRAWTDPKYAARWSWGRQHLTISVDIDLRAGGVWRQQIRNRESGEVWSFEGEIREVAAGAKLVHTFHWWSDRGTDHGKSLVAIEFLPKGRGTEVVITHTGVTDAVVLKGTETGWHHVVDAVRDWLGDAG